MEGEEFGSDSSNSDRCKAQIGGSLNTERGFTESAVLEKLTGSSEIMRGLAQALIPGLIEGLRSGILDVPQRRAPTLAPAVPRAGSGCTTAAQRRAAAEPLPPTQPMPYTAMQLREYPATQLVPSAVRRKPAMQLVAIKAAMQLQL